MMCLLPGGGRAAGRPGGGLTPRPHSGDGDGAAREATARKEGGGRAWLHSSLTWRPEEAGCGNQAEIPLEKGEAMGEEIKAVPLWTEKE